MKAQRPKTLCSGILAALLLVSCQSDINEICGAGQEKLASEIKHARAVIGEPKGRNIASAKKLPEEILGKSWNEWALTALERTQAARDFTENDPSLAKIRHELDLLSNEWVTFFGSSEKRDPARMSESLRKIERAQADAFSRFCGSASKFVRQ